MHNQPTVSWQDVSKFIRQLNHDLRNGLNALELQATLVGEIVREPQTKGEVARLRELTGELSRRIQKLSRSVAPVQLEKFTFPAREFVEDLQERFEAQHPDEASSVQWSVSLNDEQFTVDHQLLTEAFSELLDNALRHGRGDGRIMFEAAAEQDAIRFELREPKKEFGGATDNWGARPLSKVGQGHYGLGLFRARHILEAHDGTLKASFDPAALVLVTTVELPRAKA